MIGMTFSAGATKKLLWTNPNSLSTNFAAQTIITGLPKYDALLIDCNELMYPGITTVLINISDNNFVTCAENPSTNNKSFDGWQIVCRRFIIANNNLSCTDAAFNGDVYNDRLIPLHIYGVNNINAILNYL